MIDWTEPELKAWDPGDPGKGPDWTKPELAAWKPERDDPADPDDGSGTDAPGRRALSSGAVV